MKVTNVRVPQNPRFILPTERTHLIILNKQKTWFETYLVDSDFRDILFQTKWVPNTFFLFNKGKFGKRCCDDV